MDPFCWTAPPPAELRTQHLVLSLEPSEDGVRYAIRAHDGTTLGAIELVPSGERRACIVYSTTAHASEAVATIAELAARTSQLMWLQLVCTTAAKADVARQLGFVRSNNSVWTADCDDLIAWHHVRSIATAANANVSVAGDTGAILVRAADGIDLELAIANASDAPYVTATTPIGRTDLFAPDDTLAHASSLVVGALAVRDQQLELRYGCAPSGFTAKCLSLLLHEAARLRSLIPTPRILPDAFACAL
ncbi:MAG: hypothetical protein AB7T06_33015 [Kofleriaceae bacterium]